MQNAVKKTVFILAIMAIVLPGGCTNWKTKYETLNVEHQNLKGLYENCYQSLTFSGDEKATLVKQISEGQQTIEELKRQIGQYKASPGQATGFGDDYDVAFDPDAGTITVTLQEAILFASGSAVLKNPSLSKLNEIISVLKQRYSDNPIDVVGHTDSDPIKKSKWKDNWELSAQRALAVVRYLNTHGIGAKKLRAAGCGSARPVVSNSTKSGKAQNRRVQIVVNMR